MLDRIPGMEKSSTLTLSFVSIFLLLLDFPPLFFAHTTKIERGAMHG